MHRQNKPFFNLDLSESRIESVLRDVHMRSNFETYLFSGFLLKLKRKIIRRNMQELNSSSRRIH